MRTARLVCLFILLVFSAVTAFSQTPSPSPEATPIEPEKSKERLELEKNAFKLLDDAVGDAGGLKLWENRALVYAAAGDLYWKTDQKRARKLFRDAANEIIAGNQMPKEKVKNYWEDYGYWQDTSPRRAILLLLAAHDADLALEMLLETRPPDLQAAINQQSQPKPPNVPNATEKKTSAQAANEQKNKMQVQQEISLEQQFAVKAAEQNPKKAAKLIRDSLSKGVSYAVFQLLAKINEKDEELGKELLGEIIGKILDADFAEKEDTRFVASALLQQSFNPQTYKARDEKFKPLKIEEKDLKAIAAKLADYFTNKNDFRNYWSFSEILPALEKYAPEKSSQLKQKDAAFKKLIPEEARGWQEVRKLINDPNTKPEQLIEEADKYAGYEKFELYRNAVDRSLEANTGDKIRDLLRSEPSGKQRDDALSYLDTKLSEKAIKDDKLEDAQSLVAKTESNSSKVRILVDLALGFHKKNTKESKESAVDLMTKARALVGDAPESREEVGDILKVASGYAVIEPSRAFLYLPPLIEMSNDLMMAYSLLAKYSKQEAFFKKGEMMYTQTVGNSGASYMRYGKELGLLAAADFGRAKGLIEQFRREDVRVLVKIMTAQGIFKEKMGFEGMNTYSFDDD